MKIEDLASVQTGYQFRGKVQPEIQGSHAVIQVKDLNPHGLGNPETLVRITPKGDANRYAVNRGDVLFLSRGKRNVSLPITKTYANTIATSYFFIIRPDPSVVLPEYLAWYLNQPPAQTYFKRLARGSRMLLISKAVLQATPIQLPAIEIQQSVVKAHQLFQKERQILHEIGERRVALMRAICLKAALPVTTELTV